MTTIKLFTRSAFQAATIVMVLIATLFVFEGCRFVAKAKFPNGTWENRSGAPLYITSKVTVSEESVVIEDYFAPTGKRNINRLKIRKSESHALWLSDGSMLRYNPKEDSVSWVGATATTVEYSTRTE